MDKKKIYGTLIGIFSFIVLIIGVTYAYFAWSSPDEQDTIVNLSVPKDIAKMIIYSQDKNFIGIEDVEQPLSSSESYDGGISATIEFWKKPDVNRQIYGKIYLDILDMLSATNTEDANIAKTDTLKWTITSYSCENDYSYNEETKKYSCNNELYPETVINEGTFNGRKIDDVFAIAQDFELNNYPTYYKIYLWVDKNEIDLSLSITGELISVEISAEAYMFKNDVANMLVMNEAKAEACEVGGSGVCAISYTDSETGETWQDYRYRGANVNNYVKFNDDMYRIIGVFDEHSHGVEGEQLVKLISANIMTSAAGVYNTSDISGVRGDYSNDWTGEKLISSDTDSTSVLSLNKILNEYFYEPDINNFNTCANWRYYYDSVPKEFYRNNNCSDIYVQALDNVFRSYIENVTWHLRGYNGDSFNNSSFYLCERGLSSDLANCKSANDGQYSSSYDAKIGLMYVSDYLYACGINPIENSTNIASLLDNAIQNWLYRGNEYTMTPSSANNNSLFTILSSGRIGPIASFYGFNIRPVFYLKSNVVFNGGNGSFEHPFEIKM